MMTHLHVKSTEPKAAPQPVSTSPAGEGSARASVHGSGLLTLVDWGIACIEAFAGPPS